MPAVHKLANAHKIGRCEDCVGVHGAPCTQHGRDAFNFLFLTTTATANLPFNDL
jgi:hypothetical protein